MQKFLWVNESQNVLIEIDEQVSVAPALTAYRAGATYPAGYHCCRSAILYRTIVSAGSAELRFILAIAGRTARPSLCPRSSVAIAHLWEIRTLASIAPSSVAQYPALANKRHEKPKKDINYQ